MRVRPGSIVLAVAMTAAAVGVLRSHQHRAAEEPIPHTADIVGDPWGDARADPYDAPARAATPQPLDPFFVSDLTFVIQNLGDLIADGRRQCDALGDPRYEPGYADAKGKAQIAAWQAFARDWSDRLDRVASDLPDPPDMDAQPGASLAYQDVGRAVQELRLVPVGAGDWATPFESLWSSRFATAEHHLNAARARLESDRSTK